MSDTVIIIGIVVVVIAVVLIVFFLKDRISEFSFKNPNGELSIKADTKGNHNPSFNNQVQKNLNINEKELITKYINKTDSAIYSFSGDLSWFPEQKNFLLEKINSNTTVKILCKDPLSEASQRNVRDAMQINGIQIKLLNDYDPFIRGMLFDPNVSGSASAGIIVLKSKIDAQREHFIFDTENLDLRFIKALSLLFDFIWEKAEDVSILSSIDEVTVVNEIKKIEQYKNAKISYKPIKITKLHPLHRNLNLVRLERIKALQNRLQNHNMSIWDCIKLEVGKEIIPIVPPIIEVHNDKYIIIDGAHRVYYAKEQRLDTIKCIIVENVQTPLPGEPIEWSSIHISSNQIFSKKENFVSYNAQNWRDIKNIYSKLKESLNKAKRP